MAVLTDANTIYIVPKFGFAFRRILRKQVSYLTTGNGVFGTHKKTSIRGNYGKIIGFL